MKYIELNNNNIKICLKKIHGFASDKAINSKDLLTSVLIIEDVLLEVKAKNNHNVQFKYEIKKHRHRMTIRICFKCEKLPSFNKNGTTIQKNLYEISKIKPLFINGKTSKVYICDVPIFENLFIGNLKFNWRFMKHTKVYSILAIILQLISVALNIVIPLLTAKIIVQYTESVFSEIFITALLILITWLVNYVCVCIESLLCNKVYFDIRKNLSIYISSVILKLQHSCIDSKGTGVFTQRLTTDLENICLGITRLVDYLTVLIKYIGALIAMAIISWIAFCYVAIGLLLCLLIETLRAKKVKRLDRTYRKANDNYSSFIVEMVHGISDIKLLNIAPNFIKQLSKRVSVSNSKAENMYSVGIKYATLKNSFNALWDFGFMVILAYTLSIGEITAAGAMVLFNYNLTLGFNVLVAIQNLYDFIRSFNLSAERLYSLIDNWEFPREKFGKTHLDKVNGDLEIKNVNFSYNHADLKKRDIPILKGLSFKVPAKQTVALVGKSGTGKTTIAKLLTKLEEYYEGKILIDGININDLDEESLKNNIIMVSQDPHIFNVSVRDNLLMIKPSATDEEIIEVCKQACIYDEILALSEGFDTIIGENGINLSGGQKQRLSIARSLLNKTKIIILDESTSSLDNITQNNVMKAIDNLKGIATVIIIAHRLSTIKDADVIYFLEDGRITASGTHEELLNNCKQYKELYKGEYN